jgi:hypothetical protein
MSLLTVWLRMRSILLSGPHNLRRMHILLLEGREPLKCQLDQLDGWCSSLQQYPYWFSACWSLSYWQMLMFPTTMVHLSISLCSSTRIFCPTYFKAHLLSVLTFRIAPPSQGKCITQGHPLSPAIPPILMLVCEKLPWLLHVSLEP